MLPFRLCQSCQSPRQCFAGDRVRRVVVLPDSCLVRKLADALGDAPVGQLAAVNRHVTSSMWIRQRWWRKLKVGIAGFFFDRVEIVSGDEMIRVVEPEKVELLLHQNPFVKTLPCDISSTSLSLLTGIRMSRLLERRFRLDFDISSIVFCDAFVILSWLEASTLLSTALTSWSNRLGNKYSKTFCLKL